MVDLCEANGERSMAEEEEEEEGLDQVYMMVVPPRPLRRRMPLVFIGTGLICGRARQTEERRLSSEALWEIQHRENGKQST